MIDTKASSITDLFPRDLQMAMEFIYNSCGIELTNPKIIPECKDYGACSFELNGKHVQHRLSKITPKKTGQFVTIWKRNKEGLTAPFDLTDQLDFIVISVRYNDQFGQFIFPKSVLADQDVISKNGKGGKRGIRVYPSWDVPTNKQALKTQLWQLKYFLSINGDHNLIFDKAKQLLYEF